MSDDRPMAPEDESARARARTDFDAGLEKTIRWYRENEAWWRPVAATPRSVSSS